jgi:hypothetical protein
LKITYQYIIKMSLRHFCRREAAAAAHLLGVVDLEVAVATAAPHQTLTAVHLTPHLRHEYVKLFVTNTIALWTKIHHRNQIVA